MAAYTNVLPLTEFRPTASRPESERELRKQLAAAYRIFDYLGWTSLALIYGHITVRVSGPPAPFSDQPVRLAL